MSWALFLNLIACLFTFCVAWADHAESVSAFKAASATDRRKKGLKLVMLWGAPTVAAALLYFTWASDLEIAQIRHAAVSASPLKQPIASVTAVMKLYVAGTNQLTDVDPGGRHKPEIVSLEFGRSTNRSLTLLRLPCKKFSLVWRQNDNRERSYLAEFDTDPRMGLHNLKPTDTVEVFDTLDSVLLDAPFLSEDAKILAGDVTVIINATTRRQYYIPEQKYRTIWEGPTGHASWEFGRMDSNHVNVFVRPQPTIRW